MSSFGLFLESRVDDDAPTFVYNNHHGDETVIVFDGTFYSGFKTREQAEARLYAFAESNESHATRQYEQFLLDFPDYDDVPPVLRGFANASGDTLLCPMLRLSFGGYEATILCDYRNVEEREHADGQQFILTVSTDDVDVCQYETDQLKGEWTELALSQMFIHYCNAQGLPEMSADELIFEELTAEQRTWISQFIDLWEELVEATKLWANSFSKDGCNEDDVHRLVRDGDLGEHEKDILDEMEIGDIWVDEDGDSWERTF